MVTFRGSARPEPQEFSVVAASCVHLRSEHSGTSRRYLWVRRGDNWHPFDVVDGPYVDIRPEPAPDSWADLRDVEVVSEAYNPAEGLSDGQLDPATRAQLEGAILDKLGSWSAGLIEPTRIADLSRAVVDRLTPVIASIDDNARQWGYREGYHAGRSHSPAPAPADEAFRGPAAADPPDELEYIRRFFLHRQFDVTAVTGTGVVAVGVEWPDKTCSLRWVKGGRSTVYWDNVGLIRETHCHEKSPTALIWID